MEAEVYIEKGQNARLTFPHRAVTGTRNTIALRIVSDVVNTTMNATVLSDEIFGTSGDTFNLRSQYLACSFNQLDFTPSTQSGVKNGIFDLTLEDFNVIGFNHDAIEDAVVTEGYTQLGNMSALFHHVMLCFPPGVTFNGSPNWVAYSYINSYLSVYNDNWCGR